MQEQTAWWTLLWLSHTADINIYFPLVHQTSISIFLWSICCLQLTNCRLGHITCILWQSTWSAEIEIVHVSQRLNSKRQGPSHYWIDTQNSGNSKLQIKAHSWKRNSSKLNKKHFSGKKRKTRNILSESDNDSLGRHKYHDFSYMISWNVLQGPISVP